jgi:hypothetical protein
MGMSSVSGYLVQLRDAALFLSRGATQSG